MALHGKVEDNSSELIRSEDITAFDRWSLPSFDKPLSERETPLVVESEVLSATVEDVALESVDPPTLEEIEAIRQDAYNEGFTTGERDGFHAGQLKARQEADEVLKERLANLELLMSQLFEPIAEQDKLIEQAMLSLVNHVSRQVIQRELHMDSGQVLQVLRGALKLLPMGADNICIYVNPQDFARIKEFCERHEESWYVLEDDVLLPGGCRIEAEHSRIDATIETRLAQAVKQLFEQQREQATHSLAGDILDLETSGDSYAS